MLSSSHTQYVRRTDRFVTIHWSSLGHVERRKQRWGGKANSWNMMKLHDGMYLIPNTVSISTIDAALSDVLAPSDRAALLYPYGTTGRGSSAMTVRLYGKAATTHKEAG